MSRKAVLRWCREIRDAEISAPVYRAGRYDLVNWLRDMLGQVHVKGFDPDWDEVLEEVERVRGDWPASLVDWSPPLEKPMSMYDIMTGGPLHPITRLVFGMLGINRPHLDQIPRFRDTYLVTGADGVPRLGMLTRTGGGNRADYAEGNAFMETLPGFIETTDLDIDTTYALWEYAVPEDVAEGIAGLIADSEARHIPIHPRAKMQAGLDRVKAGNIPPELAQVGAAIEAAAAGDEAALKATGANVRKEPNVSEDGVGEDITIIEL